MEMSNERKKILEFIAKYAPVRSSEIATKLNISTKNLYKHLGALLDESLIKKEGKVPRVYYSIRLKEPSTTSELTYNSYLIDQNYIYVSSTGEMVRGVRGFMAWCLKNKFNFEIESKKFIRKLKAVINMKREGLISARKKILSKSNKIFLDGVYFSDFYTLDYFGKTKLGQLVYLAKTSQNKEFISEIIDLVSSTLYKLVENKSIKYLCFVPPTIERKVQIMKEVEKKMEIGYPRITISKVNSSIKIPQKTLRKLEDRIQNAKSSITVNPSQIINGNVLIIDDATGSGATLNEIAQKIKNINSEIKVFGYSFVGSYKGFDVISEV